MVAIPSNLLMHIASSDSVRCLWLRGASQNRKMYNYLLSAKNSINGCCSRLQRGWFDFKIRLGPNNSCNDISIYLDPEIQRIFCCCFGALEYEKLFFLANNPF